MSFFFFFRKTSPPAAKKRPRKGKSDLAVQLELTTKQKREAERKAAQLQREIDEVPKKLKELEEAEKRKMQDRAKKSPTIHGLGRPVQQKLEVSAVRMTGAQRRAMRIQFALLCIALAAVLLILWRVAR